MNQDFDISLPPGDTPAAPFGSDLAKLASTYDKNLNRIKVYFYIEANLVEALPATTPTDYTNIQLTKVSLLTSFKKILDFERTISLQPLFIRFGVEVVYSATLGVLLNFPNTITFSIAVMLFIIYFAIKTVRVLYYLSKRLRRQGQLKTHSLILEYH